MDGEKYFYATSEDGPFKHRTVEEAFRELVEINSYGTTIYRAVASPVTILSYASPEMLVDDIYERATDDVGDEGAGSWLGDITKEQFEDLGARIEAWATEHDLQPNFYGGVRNVEELQVEISVVKVVAPSK